MNFNFGDLVQFKSAQFGIKHWNCPLLDKPSDVDTEWEKKLIDKYNSWKIIKVQRSVSIFRNRNPDILAIDSFQEEDEERINLLSAICDGISYDKAKNLLELSNHNLEEAEILYKSQQCKSPLASIFITFILPNGYEFSRSYALSSSIWDIGTDIYTETGSDSEFQIRIQETNQLLDIETIMTATFSQLNLKGQSRFIVTFL